MTNSNQNPCPICKTHLDPSDAKVTNADADFVNCKRCGEFLLSRSLSVALPHKSEFQQSRELQARVSYALRIMQRTNDPPMISETLFDELLKRDLPSLPEQLDKVILWVGSNTSYGEDIYINLYHDLSLFGAINLSGLVFLLSSLEHHGLISLSDLGEMQSIRLTFNGWDEYTNMLTGAKDSRKAFIAMQYGDTELDSFVNNYFRQAVKETGFNLVRLDDKPQAGLIDDRLRIEIQTSKFLIADLTHENRGAYWEAGYAEGLGKPVIYTCEISKFEESSTHFDTNHHLTVPWDKEAPKQFQDKLKATIRATFLDEAVLEN